MTHATPWCVNKAGCALLIVKHSVSADVTVHFRADYRKKCYWSDAVSKHGWLSQQLRFQSTHACTAASLSALQCQHVTMGVCRCSVGFGSAGTVDGRQSCGAGTVRRGVQGVSPSGGAACPGRCRCACGHHWGNITSENALGSSPQCYSLDDCMLQGAFMAAFALECSYFAHRLHTPQDAQWLPLYP